MEGSETPKDVPEGAKTKRDPDKLKETLSRYYFISLS